MAGLHRYLYPDAAAVLSNFVDQIEHALRRSGLIRGDEQRAVFGQGLRFAVAGDLDAYCESLGLFAPYLEILTSNGPRGVTVYADVAPGEPIMACSRCGYLRQSQPMGRNPKTGEPMAMPAAGACFSCGGETWGEASSPVVFEAPVALCLTADGFDEARPTIKDGCPVLWQSVGGVLAGEWREVAIEV